MNDNEGLLMKQWMLPWFAVLCLVIAGCTSNRSISNSAYRAKPSGSCFAPPVNVSDPAFMYRGELSELDVLGIDRERIASEEDIRRALESSKRVRLRPGGAILLVQSGALFPDGSMVAEMGKYFTVIPFSGVPTEDAGEVRGARRISDPATYSRSLRLAAARGGAEEIVCYWGLLESVNEKMPTKTISWVPLASWLVPDERQHMRIRLKVALVDVRSGSWSFFSSEPFTDEKLSTSPRREVVDQKQVELLKKKAYQASVNELVKRYADSRAAP